MKLANFVSKVSVKINTKMKTRPIRKDIWSGLRKIRKNFGSFIYFFKSEDFDILEVVIQIANEKDVKPAQIALAWLLEKNITSPIIGVTKKSHVEEAIDSLNIKLTSDDIKRLEEPYQVHSVHHLD